MGRSTLLAFVAGAIAVVVFHQGTLFLLHHQFPLLQAIGVPTAFRPPGAGYSFAPTRPLGVPQLLSIMFWGGLWGIALAWTTRRAPDLLGGFLFGAILCTLVAFTLVPYLRGAPMWGGGNIVAWLRAILLNGAWGWGTALLLRVIGR
jgi:hypothetical protein